MMAAWVFVTVFVGDVNLDRFQRWLWGTPQQQQQQVLQEYDPALREQVEALFPMFQDRMSMLYEVDALRRELLTLPALPDEGY
jgi:hypothetical protein